MTTVFETAEKRDANISLIINNSDVHLPIVLEFGRLMRCDSPEMRNWTSTSGQI